MSNSLGPDQARHIVRPNLDPNCLQKLSADNTFRQRVNCLVVVIVLYLFLMVPWFPMCDCGLSWYLEMLTPYTGSDKHRCPFCNF